MNDESQANPKPSEQVYDGLTPLGNKGSIARLEAKKRRHQAMQLREAGFSYAQIAEKLGYSSSGGAYQAIQTVLREEVYEPKKEVRLMEARRMDKLLSVWFPRAMTDLDAANYVDKLLTRRAKFFGLDAPQQVAVAGADGGPIEVSVKQAMDLSRLSDDELKLFEYLMAKIAVTPAIDVTPGGGNGHSGNGNALLGDPEEPGGPGDPGQDPEA